MTQPQTQPVAVRSTGSGVAVIIPCLNEAQTIGQVIDDFRRELPESQIWVIDNDSTDATATVALEHGAQVLTESLLVAGAAGILGVIARYALDRAR